MKKFKSKIQEIKEDPKGSAKKAGKAVARYVKENPEDAAIWGAATFAPPAAIAKAGAKGIIPKKVAVPAAAIAGAAPLGTMAVAGKHAIRAALKKKETTYSDKIRETIRKAGHGAVDAVVDNPLDTGAYVASDLVLPGYLAKKAAKKWKGPKGKAAAAALGVYAMSPVGLGAATIAAKNKWKAKKKKE